MLKSRQQIRNRQFVILGHFGGTKVLCEDGTFERMHLTLPEAMATFDHIEKVSYRLLKLRLATAETNYCIGEIVKDSSWQGHAIRKLAGKPTLTKPKIYFRKITEELRRL